jgi:GTPase SAR1 family protein
MESTGTPALKCVFVGNGSIGKTSLLLTLANGKYPSEYVASDKEESYSKIQYYNNFINYLSIQRYLSGQFYTRRQEL